MDDFIAIAKQVDREEAEVLDLSSVAAGASQNFDKSVNYSVTVLEGIATSAVACTGNQH